MLIIVSGGDPGSNRSVISWIETDLSDSDGDEELYSIGMKLWNGYTRMIIISSFNGRLSEMKKNVKQVYNR